MAEFDGETETRVVRRRRDKRCRQRADTQGPKRTRQVTVIDITDTPSNNIDIERWRHIHRHTGTMQTHTETLGRLHASHKTVTDTRSQT